MGADLDVCVETPSQTNEWSLVAHYPMVHRGPEQDFIRRNGRECDQKEIVELYRPWIGSSFDRPPSRAHLASCPLLSRMGPATLDALFENAEPPYWVNTFDGQRFVMLIDTWKGKPWPMFDGDEVDGEFSPSKELLAAVESIRSLINGGSAVRVVCWYGQ